MSRALDILLGKVSISDKPPTPPTPVLRVRKTRAKPRPRMREIETPDLLDHDAILARSVSKRLTVRGVYFLIRGRRIVYVGQSINVHIRIDDHKCDASKQFDSYAVVECKPAMLDALEAKYIRLFAPQYNVTRNTGRIFEHCTDETNGREVGG